MEEVSCGVIPLKKEQNDWFVFLIQHKRGGHWGFPKGHLERKEEKKEAAFRELLEETNLHVKKELLSEPLVESYQFEKEGKTVYKKVYYFLAEVKGNFHLQKEEIANGKWVTFAHAYALLTFAESKSLLQQAELHLS